MKNNTQQPNIKKAVFEYGPIFVFFVVYWHAGLFPATASIIITTTISVIFLYVSERKVPAVPLFTAIIVGVFGGLTLWLQDETFIKMKPTIIQVLFGLILLIGKRMNKLFIKSLMGHSLKMSNLGWEILTQRLSLFFFGVAFLNELVWRTQTTDLWVNFKVFGITGLTLIFFLSQITVFKKYSQNDIFGK